MRITQECRTECHSYRIATQLQTNRIKVAKHLKKLKCCQQANKTERAHSKNIFFRFLSQKTGDGTARTGLAFKNDIKNLGFISQDDLSGRPDGTKALEILPVFFHLFIQRFLHSHCLLDLPRFVCSGRSCFLTSTLGLIKRKARTVEAF